MDLAIGSEKDNIEGGGGEELNPVLIKGETQDATSEALGFTPAKKGPKKKAEAEFTKEGELKFVELTRLLPPVPKKGSFEVDSVKKSLYFFS